MGRTLNVRIFKEKNIDIMTEHLSSDGMFSIAKSDCVCICGNDSLICVGIVR